MSIWHFVAPAPVWITALVFCLAPVVCVLFLITVSIRPVRFDDEIHQDSMKKISKFEKLFTEILFSLPGFLYLLLTNTLVILLAPRLMILMASSSIFLLLVVSLILYLRIPKP